MGSDSDCSYIHWLIGKGIVIGWANPGGEYRCMVEMGLNLVL